MRFRVMNVGHGSCAYLCDAAGELTVFDCGSTEGKVSPSEHFQGELGKNTIRRLVISHYHEDHISDLPNLAECLTVDSELHRNETVTPDSLEALVSENTGELSPAMVKLREVMKSFSVSAEPQTSGFKLEFHHHSWPRFRDPNNLSLVTFLKCPGKTFLLPGDLEEIGWEDLLEFWDFRERLGKVGVYIASHHGRESGYYDKVFKFCEPEAVVFSDTRMTHGTQEGMTDKYRKHVESSGRKVYTTRNDGWIEWRLDGGQWTVHTENGSRGQS